MHWMQCPIPSRWHQGWNVIVLATVECLRFKILSCQPTMMPNNTCKYSMYPLLLNGFKDGVGTDVAAADDDDGDDDEECLVDDDTGGWVKFQMGRFQKGELDSSAHYDSPQNTTQESSVFMSNFFISKFASWKKTKEQCVKFMQIWNKKPMNVALDMITK